MSQVTALQTSALPGRLGGPYTKPRAPIRIPKLFIVTATRKATYELICGRDLLFSLGAIRTCTFTLEV